MFPIFFNGDIELFVERDELDNLPEKSIPMELVDKLSNKPIGKNVTLKYAENPRKGRVTVDILPVGEYSLKKITGYDVLISKSAIDVIRKDHIYGTRFADSNRCTIYDNEKWNYGR
jgi:hypothetical protein